MTYTAEFRRKSALQRRAAKLLGARRRGKKRSSWKGIALGGGAAAALATLAIGRKKKGGAIVATTPVPAPTPKPAPSASPKQKSTPTPSSEPSKATAMLTEVKSKVEGLKEAPIAKPSPDRRKQNSERTQRRLDYLVGNAGKGSTGKYKSRETMMNDFRGKRPKSKSGSNYDRYRAAEQKRRAERRSRIDAARSRNANYSLTKTALACFARSRR
jgi:hypothetical protein